MEERRIDYSYCEVYLIDELKNKTLVTDCVSHEKVIKKSISDISLALGDIMEDGEGNFKIDDGGLVYIFNGLYYEQLTPSLFKSFLHRCLRRVAGNVSGLAMYSEHYCDKFVTSCIERLFSNPDCRYRPDRNYIIFSNGVFSLEKGILVEPETKLCSDIVIDYPYDPTARSPLFERFFEEIQPNPMMRAALLESMGSCFIDRSKVNIQFCFYWLGTGANGKSVLSDLFKECLGKRNVEVFSMEDLFRSSTSQYNIAKCDGAIVNICSDASKTDISGGNYKKFVAGEELPARNPYGQPFKVRRLPLLYVLANAMPVTTDSSDGHHRRTRPFMFSVTIPEERQDKRLTDKILFDKGRAALFNLIYKSYRELVKRDYNFLVVDEIKELQTVIRMDTNSISRWVRDSRLYPCGGDSDNIERRDSQDLYDEYRKYCENEEGLKPNSKKSFNVELQSLGFVRKRSSTGYIFRIQSRDVGLGEEVVSYEDSFNEMLSLAGGSDKVEDDIPF